MIPPLQRALERSGYDFEARWFVGFADPDATERWAGLVDAEPDVLVLLFAPWELAALRDRGVVDLADPTWPERYVTDLVRPRLDQLLATGTEVIWIGLPASADPDETAQYEVLSAIWRRAVEDEPLVTWLDGAALLAGPDGEFVAVDETRSPPVRLFQRDGRHLCPEGGRRLAAGLLDLLVEDFGVTVDPSWVDTGWEDNPAAYDADECVVQ